MKVLKSRALTELIVREFEFEWTIEEFSSNQQCQGEFIESSEFKIEMDGDDIRWTIQVYPHGDADHDEEEDDEDDEVDDDEDDEVDDDEAEEAKDRVSVYLILNSANCKITADQCFILFNTHGKEITKTYCQPEQFSSSGWGEFDLILRENLLKQLPDDMLRIVCKLRVCLNKQNTTYLLPVPQLQSSIIEDLNRANTDSIFSDVTITVCGTDFQAHKFILAARSPVFYAMFKNEMSETKSNKVEISDLKPKVFKEFLNYIYSGKVEDEDVAEGLLAAAEKYGMEDLKSLCEDILQKKTSVENCFETLSLSDVYSAKNLKARTMEFFVANADKFETPMTRLNELKISNSCLTELVEALVNDRRPKTEIPIAEFTFEWVLGKISFSHEDTCIVSPPLFAENFNEESWKIRLYPKKESPIDGKHYLSIYLMLFSSNRKAVRSKFSFSLQNIKGKEITSFQSDSFQLFETKDSTIHGKENLILTDDIFKEITSFQSDSFQLFETKDSTIHGKENLILTDDIFKEIIEDKLKIIVSTS